jgi:hypothetical protein
MERGGGNDTSIIKEKSFFYVSFKLSFMFNFPIRFFFFSFSFSFCFCFGLQWGFRECLVVAYLDPGTVSVDAQVQGISVHRDFVSAAEEELLMAALDARPWSDLSRRAVQHYGREFDYSVNEAAAAPAEPFPQFWDAFLRARLLQVGQPSEPVDQLTVNSYQPGQGKTNKKNKKRERERERQERKRLSQDDVWFVFCFLFVFFFDGPILFFLFHRNTAAC